MSSGYEIGHKQIDQWMGGVSYEVAFWNGYLSVERNRKAVLERVTSKNGIGQPLGIDAALLNEDFKVLDVGCGMAYHNSPYIDGHRIDLHYVDPLAHFYNDIAASKKLPVPEIEFAMVEYLSAFYAKGSVDLVLIQNALDHCFQPIRGILESLKILKNGGTLYLFHNRNEAEHENYMGFHQFNIDTQGEELVIWNREDRYNINELLKGCAFVRTEEVEGNIRAWIIKTSDNIPATQEDDVKVLSEQVMYCISKLLDSSFTGKFQRSFTRQRMMHLAASRVSPEIKEKIKARKH